MLQLPAASVVHAFVARIVSSLPPRSREAGVVDVERERRAGERRAGVVGLVDVDGTAHDVVLEGHRRRPRRARPGARDCDRPGSGRIDAMTVGRARLADRVRPERQSVLADGAVRAGRERARDAADRELGAAQRQVRAAALLRDLDRTGQLLVANVQVIWLSGLASMPVIVSPLNVPLELPVPDAPLHDGAGVSIAQFAGTSSLSL